jgi:uncharacterized protein
LSLIQAADQYYESIFQVRGHSGPLLGVHCRPSIVKVSSTTVLIVPGQPQTRVGAHRMFVELARDLAERGIKSLRFDCSGWGDSIGPARAFEESRFDIVTVVQTLLLKEPNERIVILGLCDGATAAMLSLPLLKADQRKILAVVLINPWTDQKQFQAKARLSDYYLQRLKSRSFWKRLLSGNIQVGTAVSGALQSVKESQQSQGSDESQLTSRLIEAAQTMKTQLLVVLSLQDFTAQTFSRWMDHDERLKKRFAPENVFRHPTADHTFSNEDDWQSACQWIGQRINEISASPR